MRGCSSFCSHLILTMAQMDNQNAIGPRAQNADGLAIDPRAAVIPIMQQLTPGRLRIIGTGFYLTRYGLFATAGHVLLELAVPNSRELGIAVVCHTLGGDSVCMRQIRTAFINEDADVAIGYADNFMEKVPQKLLMNMRGHMSARMPSLGTRLVTYTYPQNKVLDFTLPQNPPRIVSDYYEGEVLATVDATEATRRRDIAEYVPLKVPFLESSIHLKGGASGSPVFAQGRIVGIATKSWDLSADDPPLSYIAGIAHLLNVDVRLDSIPPTSWERTVIPGERSRATIAELVKWGHLLIDL